MRNFFRRFLVITKPDYIIVSDYLLTFLVHALPLSIINTIRSSLMVINLKDNKNEMEQKTLIVMAKSCCFSGDIWWDTLTIILYSPMPW